MCQALSQRDPQTAESLNSDRIKSPTYCQLDFYLSTILAAGLLFVFPKQCRCGMFLPTLESEPLSGTRLLSR